MGSRMSLYTLRRELGGVDVSFHIVSSVGGDSCDL